MISDQGQQLIHHNAPGQRSGWSAVSDTGAIAKAIIDGRYHRTTQVAP